jgi:microcystin-dependent protein
MTHGSLPGADRAVGDELLAAGGRYGGANAVMAPTGTAGSAEPVPHRPPSLGLHYLICVEGLYPTRA